MGKAGGGFKARIKEKDASLQTVLRMLLHSPCCGMLKLTWLRKVWKIPGNEFTQRLALAQTVLELWVTGAWENAVEKYCCILTLLAPFCLYIHYSHHPVPGDTALLCPGTEKAPSWPSAPHTHIILRPQSEDSYGIKLTKMDIIVEFG